MNERTEQAMPQDLEDWIDSACDDIAAKYDSAGTPIKGLGTTAKYLREAYAKGQASLATPQPQTFSIDALNALKNYQQADESGVMVLVSRQALDEAISLIEPLSAAPGGQESEAQAVAIVDAIAVDPSKRTLKSLSYEKLLSIPAGTKLYLAPPSALAIETAALRKAAALVSGNYGWEYGGGSGEYCDDFGDAVLALIPQDGITELEKFGMLCLQELNAHVIAYHHHVDLQAIVKSLIGGKQ